MAIRPLRTLAAVDLQALRIKSRHAHILHSTNRSPTPTRATFQSDEHNQQPEIGRLEPWNGDSGGRLEPGKWRQSRGLRLDPAALTDRPAL